MAFRKTLILFWGKFEIGLTLKKEETSNTVISTTEKDKSYFVREKKRKSKAFSWFIIIICPLKRPWLTICADLPPRGAVSPLMSDNPANASGKVAQPHLYMYIYL